MLIFLRGQDGYRLERKLIEFKAKFRQDVDLSGHNIVALNGEKLSLQELNEVAGAVSMFVRKRLVIIDNLFKSKSEKEFKQIAEYLERQAKGDNIIILTQILELKEIGKLPKYKSGFYDFCVKQPLSLDFKAMSQSELVNWIRQEVELSQGQITGDAISALLGLTTGDMWQLEQELKKLLAYKQGDKIEVADVKEVVSGTFSEHIFALTDAIGERKRDRAIKLLEEEMLAGKTADELLYTIIRQYRLILQVRDGFERGMSEHTLENELGLHGYFFKKIVGQAKNYSSEILKNIYIRLIKLDYQFKTGQVELLTGLDMIIAKI